MPGVGEIHLPSSSSRPRREGGRGGLDSLLWRWPTNPTAPFGVHMVGAKRPSGGGEDGAAKGEGVESTPRPPPAAGNCTRQGG